MLGLPLELPQVHDGRGRFREIFFSLTLHHGATLGDFRPGEQALLRLPEEQPPSGRPVATQALPRPPFVTVLVPGLLGQCVGDDLEPFADAIVHVESLGFPVRTVGVGGRASSHSNAVELRQQLLAIAAQETGPLLLIGHSKGAVDILEALVSFPELQQYLAAVVSVAAPIRGSPLADQRNSWYARLIRKFPSFSCPRSDQGGLESVSTEQRRRWLAENQLPRTIPYYSLGAIALEGDMSTVLRPFHEKLSRIDPRNDGQVLYNDSVIPNGTLLGYARADHFAVAIPFSRRRPILSATLLDRNAFPREVLLESILRFVEESLSDRK